MCHHRANFASRRTRAFTLIELILVLVLIAIVVGIALPSLSGFSNSQNVTDSADRVMALARWARHEAITRDISFRLNFDTVNNAYWLSMQHGASFENALQDTPGGGTGLTQLGGDASKTTQFDGVGEEMGRHFQLPRGVGLQCNIVSQGTDPKGLVHMEFQPTGRCDPGTITLKGPRGDMIELGCLTGSEQFHVLTEDERNLRSSMVVPPAQAR